MAPLREGPCEREVHLVGERSSRHVRGPHSARPEGWRYDLSPNFLACQPTFNLLGTPCHPSPMAPASMMPGLLSTHERLEWLKFAVVGYFGRYEPMRHASCDPRTSYLRTHRTASRPTSCVSQDRREAALMRPVEGLMTYGAVLVCFGCKERWLEREALGRHGSEHSTAAAPDSSASETWGMDAII